jgi:DNA-binding transcriptional LysR family regulator
MNLEELRTFLEVVETGSMVQASRRLNVTQSTVTARINGLEEELGQKLLHRNKSGAELTSPGFKFKRYAEVMVQLWAQARSEVSLPRGFTSVCNVGLEFDLWSGLGQGFLHHVRTQHPHVAIALWPGEQRMIDRWLNTGLIDIAFCYTPQSGEKFVSRALFDDELVLVSREAKKSAELDGGYIYVDHGDEFRRQHAAAFSGDVTSAITIASSAWALDHLLKEGGSGYLPCRYIGEALKRGELHIVEKAPAFSRRVYVVENSQTVRNWSWYSKAIAAASHRSRSELEL